MATIFTSGGNLDGRSSFVKAESRRYRDKELRQRVDDALEKARILLQRDGIDIEDPEFDFKKVRFQETRPRIITLQA